MRGAAATLASLGIDIVDVGRIRECLRRRPRMAARLFTAREQAYCGSKVDPAPHYAARFAAKEATAKAAGRWLRWQEVEVVSGEGGAPALRFSGESAEMAQVTRGSRFLVSISHDRDHAVAVVAMVSPQAASGRADDDRSREVVS